MFCNKVNIFIYNRDYNIPPNSLGLFPAFQTIDLAKLNRQECNDLLVRKGFFKKESKDGEVPEEFQNGPYIEKEEKKEEL